ncbi:protein prune homolog 2 [Lycorma delicatula]|uniref:protein prune homolog 2 n=1 Tax=Lycorma delicatula TaxID=130591 RepID=UPI003F513ACA
MQSSPDSIKLMTNADKNETPPSDGDRMDISEVSDANSPLSELNYQLDNCTVNQMMNHDKISNVSTTLSTIDLSTTTSSTAITTTGTNANTNTNTNVKVITSNNCITRNNTKPAITHPLDNSNKDLSISLESLDLELPTLETYTCEPVDFPNSPKELRQTFEASGIPLPQELDSGATGLSDDEEEDHSIFQAVLSPDCQDVRLKREERPNTLNGPPRLRKIALPQDILSSAGDEDQLSSVISDEDLDRFLSPELDSADELEDSILEKLGDSPSAEGELIPELTAEEERNEARNWQPCTVAGMERRIDMKVIEPFKRVLSHGGYLNAGSHNAIIVFSACFLPHHGRVDYNYVMDNLFFYVLSTLDQLITEDYVLVYLHGGTAKDCMPTFSWLKRCYQMIDRKLRKNLKRLYLVHPTFWLKTIVLMTKPFISTKFSRKLVFINSLAELTDILPLEQASIPDRVKQYDQIKQSIERTK